MQQIELKRIVIYDPMSGQFRWKEPGPKRRLGAIAGSPHNGGYWIITINYQAYLAHNLAWLYMHGEYLPGKIDHINRIRDDNRIDNLRRATRSQQGANRPSTAKSGLKGVTWSKSSNKWMARIKVDGVTKYLGVFDSAEAASAAYHAAAIKHFGEFATL